MMAQLTKYYGYLILSSLMIFCNSAFSQNELKERIDTFTIRLMPKIHCFPDANTIECSSRFLMIKGNKWQNLQSNDTIYSTLIDYDELTSLKNVKRIGRISALKQSNNYKKDLKKELKKSDIDTMNHRLITEFLKKKRYKIGPIYEVTVVLKYSILSEKPNKVIRTNLETNLFHKNCGKFIKPYPELNEIRLYFPEILSR